MMRSWGVALKARLHDHSLLVEQTRMQSTRLHLQPLIQLWTLAAGILLLAALTYSRAGYYAGFYSINSISAEIPEMVLHLITVFGDGALLLTLVLLFANKQPRLHWAVFITAIVGAVVSHVFKEYFDAARPPAVLPIDSFNLFGKAYKQHSFPSGHTLTAFLMVTVFYYYSTRIWQKAALVMAGVLVGLSRIWLGIHWPIDTLVGGALGILCGTLGLVSAHRWQAGITPVFHRFVLALLVVSALMILLSKNDYRLALPLLYISALAALGKTLRNYCLPPIPNAERALISSHAMKLPLIHVWVDSRKIFWWFLALVVGYRFLVLAQPHFSLFYDEAYYFHWSLNPDLGYYSKPPMVGWCIWLSTALLGNSVFAIKCMANVLYAASAIVVFHTIHRYSSHSNALIGGLIFITVPMIGFNSEFITTDAPLIFFWSLALFYALRAQESPTIKNWVMLGVFTGAGMLSKYTMAALPLAVFGYMLSSPGQRPRLLTAGPWLAAIIAGLIFGLNIYWNYANQWVALRHTQEISQTSGQLFHLGSLLEFATAQFFIFGAVSSYLLIQSVRAFKKTTSHIDDTLRTGLTSERFSLLMWVMLTILALISLQAFLSRAFPNWAGPWVVSASLLLAMGWQYAYSNFRFYTLLSYSLACNLLLLSLFYHWPPFLQWVDVEPNRKNDPFHRVAGWPQLGQQLVPYIEQYPKAILTSDSRDLIAYLGYYAKPGSFEFARWNPDADNIRDYYDLKVNLRNWRGNQQQEFIVVTKNPVSVQLSSRFLSTKPLGTLSTQAYADQTMGVHITLARGFLGYE